MARHAQVWIICVLVCVFVMLKGCCSFYACLYHVFCSSYAGLYSFFEGEGVGSVFVAVFSCCVCVRERVCMSMLMCACKYTYRSMHMFMDSVVSIECLVLHSLGYLLRQGLSLALHLASSARLSYVVSCLSLLSLSWDDKHMPPHSAFALVLRIWTQVLRACTSDILFSESPAHPRPVLSFVHFVICSWLWDCKWFWGSPHTCFEFLPLKMLPV